MDSLWLRCPTHKYRLAELQQSGELDIKAFFETQYIEMTCRKCKQSMRRDGDDTVSLVLHRFDLNGELVDTSVQRTDTGDRSIRRTGSGAT